MCGVGVRPIEISAPSLGRRFDLSQTPKTTEVEIMHSHSMAIWSDLPRGTPNYYWALNANVSPPSARCDCSELAQLFEVEVVREARAT